jgi:hypothetical protein
MGGVWDSEQRMMRGTAPGVAEGGREAGDVRDAGGAEPRSEGWGSDGWDRAGKRDWKCIGHFTMRGARKSRLDAGGFAKRRPKLTTTSGPENID